MPPFPKEALVCRSPRAFLFNTRGALGAGGNPRTRTACAYVLQVLTPGLQDLYCFWSRTNRLQFRRGLLLLLHAVVCVASGPALSCAVPPVSGACCRPHFSPALGGLRYVHQSLSFHLLCPDRHYYACGWLHVCDCTGGLPTSVIRRSHRGKSHDARKWFQLSYRCCKLEGRACCRSSLGQSPRADPQRRGADRRRREMDTCCQNSPPVAGVPRGGTDGRERQGGGRRAHGVD